MSLTMVRSTGKAVETAPFLDGAIAKPQFVGSITSSAKTASSVGTATTCGAAMGGAARKLSCASSFAGVPKRDRSSTSTDITYGGASAVASASPLPALVTRAVRVQCAEVAAVTFTLVSKMSKVVRCAKLPSASTIPYERVRGRRTSTTVTRGLPAIGEGAKPNVGEGRVLFDNGITITFVQRTTKGLTLAGAA